MGNDGLRVVPEHLTKASAHFAETAETAKTLANKFANMSIHQTMWGDFEEGHDLHAALDKFREAHQEYHEDTHRFMAGRSDSSIEVRDAFVEKDRPDRPLSL